MTQLNLRVAANALDLALYRRARSLAHTPETVRWVRRYSLLGEHAAVWLAGGLAGAAADRRRRGRWLRATVCVGSAYLLSTSIKLAIGRSAPGGRGPAAPDGDPDRPLVPVVALDVVVRSGAGVRQPGAATLLLAAAAAMAFSRLYLGVHYPSDVAAGAALGTVIGRLGR